jgi:hypothetical protein
MEQKTMPSAIVKPCAAAHFGNHLPRRESLPDLVEKKADTREVNAERRRLQRACDIIKNSSFHFGTSFWNADRYLPLDRRGQAASIRT